MKLHTINARNVSHALMQGVDKFRSPLNYRDITVRGSRTLELDGPTVTTYANPMERVLTEPLRDANPFFHFMESLWMLAGRNDVPWIARFSKNITNYSDNGITFNGAYGRRMRGAWHCPFVSGGSVVGNNVDQLQLCITLLKEDPDTRRAVVQLWEREDLSRSIGPHQSRDVPCNDLIMFKIRAGLLHMTVCNRSNDMIWGAYGANAVHFSYIMEYVAAHLNIGVGTYTQFSDSMHVYPDGYPGWGRLYEGLNTEAVRNIYSHYTPFPINTGVSNMVREWDADLRSFMTRTEHGEAHSEVMRGWNTLFFAGVAAPMFYAWWLYKKYAVDSAMEVASTIHADDWRIACVEWLQRRGK